MPNEPVQSLPYPASNAAVDVPADLKLLADAIAPKLMMVFTSTAARDAAITAPTAGMVCQVGSGATMDEYRHNGTSWKLWSRPRQSWTPVIGGITSGLSVEAAEYQVASGRVGYYAQLACTGALVGSALRLSGLPVAMAGLAWTPVGDATLNPNGTRVPGKVYRYSTTTEVAIFGPPGSSLVVEIAAAVPATWGARSQAIIATWDAPAG